MRFQEGYCVMPGAGFTPSPARILMKGGKWLVGARERPKLAPPPQEFTGKKPYGYIRTRTEQKQKWKGI